MKLTSLAQRAHLEDAIADLRAETRDLDEQARARLRAALGAADEAYRKHRGPQARARWPVIGALKTGTTAFARQVWRRISSSNPPSSDR